MQRELTKKSGFKGSNMKNLLAAALLLATASISLGQTRSVLMNTSNFVVQPTNAIYFQGDVNGPNFYSPGVIEGSQMISTDFTRVSEASSANPTTLVGARGIRFPDGSQTSVFYSFNDSGHKVAWAWGTTVTNISDRIIFRPNSFQVNGEIKFGNTTNAAATRTNLGGTVVGQALFTTANEAAARTTLQLASYVTNPIVPLTNGGTGANVAGQARTNLGATTVGNALFTATNEAAARTTLQLASYVTNPVVQLTNGGTGATNASGARTSLQLAAYVTNPIVPLTNGGTGANVAGQARTNLGATVVGDAVFVAVDGAAARLAIGAIASTNNITGTASNVTGVVAITNGGTGATTASGARTNLEISGGLNSTITFLAGAQTNTVTITNGIITSWTQSP
jgi:hypothetical protein